MSLQLPNQDSGLDLGDEAPEHFFSEINITPLTDVILVLLIIFMVTSSAMVDAARAGQLDVTLPSAATASAADIEANTAVVGITSDGRVFIDGEVVDNEELVRRLKVKKTAFPQTLVVIEADGALEHREVVEVIDALRENGFTNVGLGAETQ